MSRFTPFSEFGFSPMEPKLSSVRSLLAEHGDALGCAAEMLGGDVRGRRWMEFLNSVRKANKLTRRHKIALHEMYKLLTLCAIEEPEEGEILHYVGLDPADPRIHELCLLTEQLADLLARLDAADVNVEQPGDEAVA